MGQIGPIGPSGRIWSGSRAWNRTNTGRRGGEFITLARWWCLGRAARITRRPSMTLPCDEIVHQTVLQCSGNIVQELPSVSPGWRWIWFFCIASRMAAVERAGAMFWGTAPDTTFWVGRRLLGSAGLGWRELDRSDGADASD